MRTLSTYFAAIAATSGTKWMSATTAASHPSSRKRRTIRSKFSPSPTPLGRQPDDRTSGPEDAFDLPNTGFGILGVGIGHRLHGDRAVTSDHNPSDANFTARAALILGQIHVLPEFITTKVVKMKAG